MFTQQAASIAIVSSAKLYASFIDFTYAGQITGAFGRINYNSQAGIFQFFVGGNEAMRLDSNTYLGLGVTAACAPLHVYGSYQGPGTLQDHVTAGILAGMEFVTPTTAKLCICAGNNTGISNLDFSYSGQAVSGVGGASTAAAYLARISTNMGNGQLTFLTKQGAGLTIDGSVSNNTILIGTTTSNNMYRMIVTGTTYLTNLVTNNAVINGPITGVSSITASSGVFTTKPFCIPHPDTSKPLGTRLRHRCIEGERSSTFYTYRLNCSVGLNTFSLPD
jgi:hypothetical protein